MNITPPAVILAITGGNVALADAVANVPASTETIEIWKAVALTALGLLQVIAVGLLFYVVRRVDTVANDLGVLRDRVSHIEGHLAAGKTGFSAISSKQ